MKIPAITLFFLYFLLGCEEKDIYDATIFRNSKDSFEIIIGKIDNDYCVSDLFLNNNDDSVGQSIEIIDHQGKIPLFNPGISSSNSEGSFKHVSTIPFVYRVNSMYELKSGQRYKARLNVYAFLCKSESLNQFDKWSFLHSKYYGDPSIKFVSLKSSWVQFEY